jgi:hypothetical protein
MSPARQFVNQLILRMYEVLTRDRPKRNRICATVTSYLFSRGGSEAKKSSRMRGI